MRDVDTDVVIVGGGFAGVTAAREPRQHGLHVALLEARDRLGGRAWTRDTTLGRELDVGGTWVHWIQPHVRAEVTRYGLDLIASPDLDTAYWRVGEEVVTGSAEAMLDLLDAPMDAVLTESREVLPQTYD